VRRAIGMVSDASQATALTRLFSRFDDRHLDSRIVLKPIAEWQDRHTSWMTLDHAHIGLADYSGVITPFTNSLFAAGAARFG